MSKVVKTIIYFIICLFLGFLLTRQFYLNRQIQQINQLETGNSIALEVTEFIKTNNKLRKQINQLIEQKDKLEKSAASSQAANEILQENLQIYKIILGLTNTQGQGVEIIFDAKVSSTQVIDLINAVKNIGAEAITVNNRRFGPKSFVESGLFYPPTSVQIIGNAEMLKDSLIRPGGIIDQIGAGQVEKKDDIILQSVQ